MLIIKKERNTKETEIKLTFNPKGSGIYKISTGIKFFDHMLEQFTYHGNFDLDLEVNSIDKDKSVYHLWWIVFKIKRRDG